MVHRLLVALLTLAVMMVSLGSTERVFAAEPALLQGMQAPADESRGSIEDHHLDDLPSQAADNPKPDLLAFAGPQAALPGGTAAGDWAARRPPPGPQTPFLEGLLRPPRASA
jgi:hypothetical protein